jgi:hypothetical protein
MKWRWLLLFAPALHAVHCIRCPTNEILLRNQTCFCPFFKFNKVCMRQRFQTTVNTTLDELYRSSRHLLSTQPLLLTVDASNVEAMHALAASLQGLRSAGTVVTRVVDAMDVLVGGDASATLELTDVMVNTTAGTLDVVIDCRYPQVDYFFLYVHLGTTPPACPPFDLDNQCCHGRMTPAAEFFTAAEVDCTSHDPYLPLDSFVQMWNGVYLSSDRQRIQLSIALARIPSAIETTARVYRMGVGMVVFGRLAQNTEARVELVLNSTAMTTSFGAFQYSGVEYTRLQLEGCGKAVVFAHLIIKARGVDSIQNLRFQTWDGGEWRAPNCSNTSVVALGTRALTSCNVSIDPEFVEIYMSMRGIAVNKSTALYVLLQKASILTRVVAKTDDSILNHCNEPLVIDSASNSNDAFSIQVMQGTQLKYSGPLQSVQLTDVAALTLSIIPRSTLYAYAFDNVSVVYSLVDASQIMALMPDGRVTTQLERLCDAGTVCLIEDLLLGGVCQTGEKCEVQGSSLFLMPLYPWGKATLRNGTYTVMVAQIRETLVQNNDTNPPPHTIMRRLLSWLF